MTAVLVESASMLTLDVAKMKAFRVARGLTQLEAATKAKMIATRWNDIESRGRTNVTLETLGIIADVLGVDPGELLLKERKPGTKPKKGR